MRIVTIFVTIYTIFCCQVFAQNTCNWTEDASKSDKENLVELLQCLEDNEPHWLLKKHFQSVRMVMEKPNADYNTYDDEVASVLEYFKNAAQNLDNYVTIDARPLIMAYTSSTDNTVSYYWLTLPDGWDEESENYPLYLELHGSSGGKNDNPLRMLFWHLLPEPRSGTIEMQKRDGYHIHPWGRGDKFYDGIAEDDVWECLADFDSMFLTNPDRQYMYGFSMGGGGAWKLAHKTASRWAAIGCYSPYAEPTQKVANKYANVPAWIAWGGLETWAKDYGTGMRNMLLKAGDEVLWHEIPNTGHQYLGNYQVDMWEFFQAHSKPAVDTIAPTKPSNLTAESITKNSVTISWDAATDEVGVASYYLFDGSGYVKNASDIVSFSISGLTCNSDYTFKVVAKDRAGNASDTATINVATLGCTSTGSNTIDHARESKLVIYPNPAESDQMVLSLPYPIQDSQVHVEIVSVSAQTIFNQELPVNDSEIQVSLSNYAKPVPGVYLVKVQSKNYRWNGKLVIE